MSNKIKGKDLGKMIKEALLSEVDMSVFQSMIGSNFPASEFQKGEETGLTDVNFQAIQDFAKAAPDDDELDEKDVQHFMDNPDLIDTKVQSVLIAIKRLGSERWLKNQADRTRSAVQKSEQIIADIKANPAYIERQNKEQTYKNAVDELKNYGQRAFFKTSQIEGHKENRQLIVTVLKDLDAEKFHITKSGIIKLQQAKTDGETPMRPDTDFVYRTTKDPSTKKIENVGLEELKKAKRLRDRAIALRVDFQSFKGGKEFKKINSEYSKATKRLYSERTSQRLAQKRYSDFDLNKSALASLSKKASEALDRLDDLIAQAAQKDQSISDPIMKTAGGDAGKFTPDQEAVVRRLLLEQEDIVGRMKKINTISKRYFDAATTNSNPLLNKPTSEVLSEIMLLDLFNTMSKEFDSGAGAYLFEGVSQALGGFEDLYKHVYNYTPGQTDASGKPMIVEVRYVIAAKKQDVDQIGSPKRGTSDPSKIIGAEIFTPLIKFGIKLVNGVEKPFAKIEGGADIAILKGKLAIGPALTAAESIGMLYITTARTRTFKEMVEDAMAKQEEDTKKAFKAFEQYFDELRSASTNSKTYIASGVVNDGNRAIDNLENCENLFKTIIELMEYNDELDSDGRMITDDSPLAYRIDEQKVTSDFLKKLIKETLKK